MTKIYNNNTNKIKCDDSFSTPYWWNEEIEEQILYTRSKRRKLVRRREDTEREVNREVYKNARKTLNYKIRRAKKKAWNDLQSSLDNDIFGDGYRIVRAQLKAPLPKVVPINDDKTKVFKELFSCDGENSTQSYEKETVPEFPTITVDEVIAAAKKNKMGRAPGPDGISAQTVKIVILDNLDYFTTLFNNLIRERNFPIIWKTAKLILIEKPKKNKRNQPKYRPICLLNIISKTFENLLNERLQKEINERGGLNELQFGFRKRKTTVNAIEYVVRGVTENQRNGGWSGLLLIDVKNAFNCASWALILEKMKHRGISGYLIRVIQSYFTNIYVEILGAKKCEVFGGVPQGSVLVPTLWNL